MDSSIVEIYVETPNHWQWPSEQIWAKQIEEHLFEVQSIPYAAYGLNRGDIVRTEPSDRIIERIVSVEKPSGHRTVRIIFTNPKMPIEERVSLMEEFKKMECEFERVNDNYFAIDAATLELYDVLCASLLKLQSGGVLAYETCEPRVPGSFGDLVSSEFRS